MSPKLQGGKGQPKTTTRTPLPDPDRLIRAGDLILTSKARELAGKPGPAVSRPTLLRWRETRGFPEPVAMLPVGRGKRAQTVDLYSRAEVIAWRKANAK